MMVEEDQISFPSDAHMSDGVEDYAHQIAEMIGLRNEFNFNEAGVSCCQIPTVFCNELLCLSW
jgi:hypothetical protein